MLRLHWKAAGFVLRVLLQSMMQSFWILCRFKFTPTSSREITTKFNAFTADCCCFWVLFGPAETSENPFQQSEGERKKANQLIWIIFQPEQESYKNWWKWMNVVVSCLLFLAQKENYRFVDFCVIKFFILRHVSGEKKRELSIATVKTHFCEVAKRIAVTLDKLEISRVYRW